VECGCPECAASAQNQGGDLVIGGAITPSKLEQFLALCDPHLVGFSGLFKCLFSIEFDLVGNEMFGLCDVFGSQELLGTGAARSAFAVVVPFDVDSHTSPGWLLSPPMLICDHWVWNEWLEFVGRMVTDHAPKSFSLADSPTMR
jgi:hypothetical protein